MSRDRLEIKTMFYFLYSDRFIFAAVIRLQINTQVINSGHKRAQMCIIFVIFLLYSNSSTVSVIFVHIATI
jgi:hypothetical protein